MTTDDLLKELREGGCGEYCDALSRKAADKIERLVAERDAARLISRKRKELLVEAGVLEPDECEGCKMHHPLVGEYHEHGPSGIRTKCSSVTRSGKHAD